MADEPEPIMVDPNLEDLRLVVRELQLAEKLGKATNRKFYKIPTSSYGVEWASGDTKTGKLMAFVHFHHGKSTDKGARVRLGRVLRGCEISTLSGVPFVVVAMRGPKTGTITITPDLILQWPKALEILPVDRPEVVIDIPETAIKIMGEKTA